MQEKSTKKIGSLDIVLLNNQDNDRYAERGVEVPLPTCTSCHGEGWLCKC
jgi:hypothetical protein